MIFEDRCSKDYDSLIISKFGKVFGKDILDVGCGIGNKTVLLKGKNK